MDIKYGNYVKPIFVMGTPRSGTTLVAKILNKHSRIYMPGETHFFEDIYSRKKELGNPISSTAKKKIIQRLSTLYERYNEPEYQEKVERLIFKNDKNLQRIEKECNSYKDILDAFMGLQTLDAKKWRWGNNTPRDIFEIERILRFYPEAKILLCVRDIRDFLLSYKKRWQVVPHEHGKRLRKIYHPIIVSMLWKSAVKKIREIENMVNKSNVVLIRYESLVEHPEDMVRKICDTVEENFEAHMLNIDFSNSSTTFEQKGIFTASIGRWKNLLTTEEASVAQVIARGSMNKLGYKLVKLETDKKKVFKIIASTPIAMVKGVYATREFYSPIIPYILKRLRYGLR